MSDSTTDSIARERIENLREEMRQINQRLDDLAQGAIEKIKGDTQLATQVSQIQVVVDNLDRVLIRGESNMPSLKSTVENLKVVVEEAKKSASEAKSSAESAANSMAEVEVAKLSHKSDNWKTTATLVGTFLTAIAGLALALLK